VTKKRAPRRAKSVHEKKSGGRRAKAPPRAKSRPPAAAASGPGRLTQAQYARRRGVSREAVRKAVRDGRIRLIGGKVDPAAADSAWAANSDPSKASVVPATLPAAAGDALGAAGAATADALSATTTGLPVGVTYADARAIREWNQALLLEQERRKRAGELAEIAHVVDVFYRAWRTARDRIMAVPDLHDADLAAMTDSAAVNARLKLELRSVFDELSAALESTDVLTETEAAS